MTTHKRRLRQEWARNLAKPQVRESARIQLAQIDASVQNAAPTADLFIYDVIDSYGGEWGISSAEVVGLLGQCPSGTQLSVRLNSPGGDFFEGVAIANALRRFDGTVAVYVDGLAASAASVIALAGDRIVMGIGSQLMIHEASTIAMGTAKDMRATADMLDQTNDDIAGMYAAKSGGDVANFRAQMAAETWFTAELALAAGLATELASKPPAPPAEEDDADEDDDEGKAPPYKKKNEAETWAYADEMRELLDGYQRAVLAAVSRETDPRPVEPTIVRPSADVAETLRAALQSANTSSATTPEPSTPLPSAEPVTATAAAFNPGALRSALREATR